MKSDGNPKIVVRLKPAEKRRLHLLAEMAGVTVSTLVRRACRPLLEGIEASPDDEAA